MTFSHAEQKAAAMGYKVDADGALRSPRGKKIGGWICCGYQYFWAGAGTKCRTNRLAAYQKFGDKIYQPDMQVRHLDGNKLNNSAANIEIGTAVDNAHDIPAEVRHANAKHAAKFRKRKHNHALIISQRNSGQTIRAIAEQHGIGPKHVWFIIKDSLTSKQLKQAA